MPFFTHDNVRLFYTSSGEGPPILLLHGWTCDSHDWSFQIPFLLSLGFNVIALDQRGHGNSGNPTNIYEYTPHNFATDAVALVKHLNVGPVILVGHSMGTVISSVIAAEYPEVVKALVLVHPIYAGNQDNLTALHSSMIADPNRAPELAEQFFRDRMGYTSNTPEWLKTWHLRRVLGSDPEMILGCLDGFTKVYETVFGESYGAGTYMGKRKGPRLVVCILPGADRRERDIGLAEGDEICAMNEGTFSHQVESEKFNSILEQWLRSINQLPI